MKKILFLLIAFALSLVQSADAQTVRWSVRPVFGLYDWATLVIAPLGAVNAVHFSNVISESRVDRDYASEKAGMRVIQMAWPFTMGAYKFLNLESGGEKVDYRSKKFKDYNSDLFGNFYTGISADIVPINFPFGLDLSILYERESYRMQFPNDESYRYRRNFVRPEAILIARFGNYTRGNQNFVLEAGASYNHFVRCRGKYSDLNSVEDGMTLIGGIGGINTLTGVKWGIRYRHDCFNYFNKDFTPDGTTYPYKDLKSYRGVIEFVCNMVF